MGRITLFFGAVQESLIIPNGIDIVKDLQVKKIVRVWFWTCSGIDYTPPTDFRI